MICLTGALPKISEALAEKYLDFSFFCFLGVGDFPEKHDNIISLNYTVQI